MPIPGKVSQFRRELADVSAEPAQARRAFAIQRHVSLSNGSVEFEMCLTLERVPSGTKFSSGLDFSVRNNLVLVGSHVSKYPRGIQPSRDLATKVGWAVLFVICSGFVVSVASSGERPVAFRDTGSSPRIPSNMLDPTVLRVRPVFLNTALFSASATHRLASRLKHDRSACVHVVMNVFPDVVLQVCWNSAEENEQGGIVWTGSLESAPHGDAVLIIAGRSVTGNISRGNGKLYQIRTAEDGTIWLREIDQTKFPKEKKPLTGG